MKFDLAIMVRRARNPRRSAIILRDINPPAIFAGSLYAHCYKPIADLWEQSAVGILAEYERSLSALTTDSADDLQARLDAADSEFERVLILLEANLRDWLVRTEVWQRGKWRGAVLSASGVDLETLLGPGDVQDTLRNYLRWNVDLIRDVSRQARQKIATAVFTGLTRRRPAADVVKEVREATGFARDRSKRIAADQLAKVNAALASERRRQAGLTIYKWRHSGKRHPRSWHQHRDGLLFAEDAADTGRVINGATVNAPIEAEDRAGHPPFCGCREIGVIDLS